MTRKGIKNKSMATQKLLFFVGFLVMAAIFIYSYSQPKLQLSLPQKGNPNASQRTLLHSKPKIGRDVLSKNFRLVIKVLAYNRLESVSRCLESLAKADYDKDSVKLHIFVDHFGIEEQGKSAVPIDVDRLQAQWLEAWWPSSDDEFAFIVEDDMVLSPLFYIYLRALIATYYYNPENYSPMIYGASLQRPRFVGGKHGNKLKVDDHTRLFLYQMVGTWGQLLFPKPWKEFRLWYDMHKSKGIKPILQGMVTNGWYKRMREKIWTPWFIKFIHTRGYYNLYTNLLLERALSVSYRDAGVNYGKKVGPDSQLINSSDIPDINLWEMKPLKLINWYDFCFQKVLVHRLVKKLDELETVLSSVHEQKRVVLVSLFRIPDAIVRNLLCQFKKSSIRNYILLGEKTNLLEDLARRGHATIDADQLLDDMTRVGLVDQKFSKVPDFMEALVYAHIIKKSLLLNYSIWLTKANIIPTEAIFSSESYLKNDAILLETDQQLRTELLYLKSSEATIQLMSNVLVKLTEKTTSSVIGDLPEGEDIFGFQVRSAITRFNFRIKLIDASLMTHVGSYTSNSSSKTSSEPVAKVLFWPPNKDTDYVKERLTALDMWLIDDELSCTSIICHQS
ncbi:uncharacterized protein LOC131031271 isoform X2 [Cryptomeria japonica]|uniref:uncharacterized protein LOC131031271 isoform X2 n=1 Tax=Cryptomeria japonica TaxID=3369 RepID=UPI0027DA6470|nr:uncharacterized protein LOC131031271 isoform X2 [Cryptomeria japonica]